MTTPQRIKRRRGKKASALNPRPGSRRVYPSDSQLIPRDLRITQPQNLGHSAIVQRKRFLRKKRYARSRHDADNPLHGGVDALNACFPKVKPKEEGHDHE
jgi:hypothetical protein